MEQAEGLEEHCSEVAVAKLPQRSCCSESCIPNGAGYMIGGVLQRSPLSTDDVVVPHSTYEATVQQHPDDADVAQRRYMEFLRHYAQMDMLLPSK